MIYATVIIAAWNAKASLGRCVASALAGAGPEVEAVIVDDASTDGTLALARALAATDPRVRALALPANLGPAAARNRAIEAARGEWVAVLDADDALAPSRLRKVADFAKAAGADVVLDNLKRVDANGEPIDPGPFLAGAAATGGRWDLERFVRGNAFSRGERSLGYLKPTFRRAFLMRSGLRYDETLRNSEDYHLIAECLAQGAEVWFRPEIGYLYTVRSGSISQRLGAREAAALLAADDGFLARHGPRLAPAARSALRRRRAAIADLAAAEAALGALRAGKAGRATAVLARRPRAILRACSQLGEAIAKRVGRAAEIRSVGCSKP